MQSITGLPCAMKPCPKVRQSKGCVGSPVSLETMKFLNSERSREMLREITQTIKYHQSWQQEVKDHLYSFSQRMQAALPESFPSLRYAGICQDRELVDKQDQ